MRKGKRLVKVDECMVDNKPCSNSSSTDGFDFDGKR